MRALNHLSNMRQYYIAAYEQTIKSNGKGITRHIDIQTKTQVTKIDYLYIPQKKTLNSDLTVLAVTSLKSLKT